MQKAQAINVRAFIDEHPVSRHQMLITGLILLVVAFDGMDIGIMGYATPDIIRTWGISKPEAYDRARRRLLFRGLDGPRAQLTTRLRPRPPHHAMTAIARGTQVLATYRRSTVRTMKAREEPHGGSRS
jgi:hypothetical protein